jgi:23S rRNA G2445 N2-methylase RlmL
VFGDQIADVFNHQYAEAVQLPAFWNPFSGSGTVSIEKITEIVIIIAF